MLLTTSQLAMACMDVSRSRCIARFNVITERMIRRISVKEYTLTRLLMYIDDEIRPRTRAPIEEFIDLVYCFREEYLSINPTHKDIIWGNEALDDVLDILNAML